MNKESKKITFSFSKLKKPTLINKVNIETKDKIEYVDCFDGSKGKFSYKGNIKNEPQKQELVIPMPVSSQRTSAGIVKSRIEGKVKKITESTEKNNLEHKLGNTEESLVRVNNIDELAALEILKEAQSEDLESKNTKKLIIEAKNLVEGDRETDIDYENIPVKDFGLAMLRGMGWRPDLGIGKDPRLVKAASPKLRPKGLGLGAQQNTERSNEKIKDEKKKSYKTSVSDNKIRKHRELKT